MSTQAPLPSETQTQAQVQSASHLPAHSGSFPALCLVAGWLVPGAGHFMLRKPIRGALLLFAVLGMFGTGIALQGKIYAPSSDILDLLGFIGQLGNGLLYILARTLDWGKPSVLLATADYGTKFLVVAGLLNVISAIDAHSLAIGRKAS